MPLPETLYEAALMASRPGLRLAALVHDRTAQAVEGRRESLRRFQEWGRAERRGDRRLVWLHAPSVGEGLMAQAIIEEIRRTQPDTQIAFTHFSPSAERIADRVGADVHGYLPWDTRPSVRRTLDALRPDVIAFVRTEVWPVVTREARGRRVRLVMVNAVLAEGSGRLNWAGRRFLEPVYRRLDAVGAVSEDHARRYELLGVPPGAIHVTGDARFDQVWARVSGRALASVRSDPASIDRLDRPLRELFLSLRDAKRFTIVAGSTWESDDAVLLPVLGMMTRERSMRLILAPHEPSERHLTALEQELDRHAIRHARLAAVLAAGSAARPPEAIIVDRLGVLADLYALADVAYVGGGFHSAGLHSVVEPAALAVPVVYGPDHGNAREADALAAAGGGFVADGSTELMAVLDRLLASSADRRDAGARARRYVESETGAAERNAALILSGRAGNERRVPV